jgi:hypothetical protein
MAGTTLPRPAMLLAAFGVGRRVVMRAAIAIAWQQGLDHSGAQRTGTGRFSEE